MMMMMTLNNLLLHRALMFMHRLMHMYVMQMTGWSRCSEFGDVVCLCRAAVARRCPILPALLSAARHGLRNVRKVRWLQSYYTAARPSLVGGCRSVVVQPGALRTFFSFSRFRQVSSWHHRRKHTHPFNGPLSGTTRVSRHQKGKADVIRRTVLRIAETD